MTNHLVKTAAAVMVLLVCLEVLGKSLYSAGEDSDLYLGRPCVAFVDLVRVDNFLLLFFCHHGCFSFHLEKIFYDSHVSASGG